MPENRRAARVATPWSRRELVCLGLIVLLATGVRVHMLGDQSLWYDESDRVFIASLPVDEIFPTMAAEGLHYLPLYFFLQKPFVEPFTEMMVRFPSAWFGVLAVVLAAQVGRLLWGSGAGLIASLLLALNTFHVWYSRDASFYAVVSVATLGSLYFFLRLLRQRRPSLWIGLGLFTSLGICTHYFAFAIPIVQFVYLVLTLRRNHRLLRGWVLVHALAFLPLVPWYVFVVRRGLFYYGTAGLAAPVPLDIFYALWNYSVGYSGDVNLLIVTSLLLFIGSFALGVVTVARRRAGDERLLLLWFALPQLLAFAMAFRVPMYVDRYLMPTFPVFMLLVAAGANGLRRHARSVALVGLVISAAVATTRLYYDEGFAKEDWRGLAQHIEDNEEPGDVIVPLRYQSLTPLLGQYYRGQLALEPVLVQNDERDPDELVAGYQRVWLIVPHDHAIPDQHETIHLLARCQPRDPLDPDSYSEQKLGEWVGGHADELVWRSDFVCLSLLLFEQPEGES